jgi:hypothetical protein
VDLADNDDMVEEMDPLGSIDKANRIASDVAVLRRDGEGTVISDAWQEE